MDIWNLPGIQDEHNDLLHSKLNLSTLNSGDAYEMENVSYTSEEHNVFTM